MPRKSGGGMPFKTGHLFLLGAIVMAVVTAVLFTNMMKTTSAEKPKAVETQKVIVASEYVPMGTVLMASQLKTVDWPKKFLVPNSYFENKIDLVGRMVKSDLVPGEIVYKQKLTRDNSRVGMPVMIPDGYRAVSVGVSEVKGVAGFVKPGDHVDVMATFEIRSNRGSGKHYVTRTIVQNVVVMASAQTMVDETDVAIDKPEVLTNEATEDDDSGKKKKQKSDRDLEKERKAREKAKREAEKRAKMTSSVTLALTPEQAEKIALAQESAEIHLALRPEGDQSIAEAPGVSSAQLLLGDTDVAGWPFHEPDDEPSGESSKPAEPAPAPAPALVKNPGVNIELIEGTARSSVNF